MRTTEHQQRFLNIFSRQFAPPWRRVGASGAIHGYNSSDDCEWITATVQRGPTLSNLPTKVLGSVYFESSDRMTAL
jgi:hypothetical protein